VARKRFPHRHCLERTWIERTGGGRSRSEFAWKQRAERDCGRMLVGVYGGV
jgi:hypothetical protein